MRGNHSQANTNSSTLLSIDIIDTNGNEIPIHTSVEQLIEVSIPRDINLNIPPMTLQNVISIINDPTINNRQFNLHYISITRPNDNISVSIHFEMRPLNVDVGYMLIYKFDDIPQLNKSINRTDGWSLLCPASKCGIYINTVS